MIKLPSGKELHTHPKEEAAKGITESHVIIDKDCFLEVVSLLNGRMIDKPV